MILVNMLEKINKEMIRDYYSFINEAKASEMFVGDYVLFGKNLKKYPVKGKFGKIVEIRPNLDNPKSILYRTEIDIVDENGQPAKTIVNLTKLDNLRVIKNDEYEPYIQGKLIEFACSVRLENLLKKIKFEIPKNKLMNISYFDVDKEKDDVVTYLPSEKSKNTPENDKYASKKRQSMKIGRFFKKIYPDIDNVEIEKLQNNYKANWINIHKSEMVIIIKGEDIRYWYFEDHYKYGGGSLNNSCMRYSHSQYRFDIYCENQNKIAQVIIMDENDKLLARAMLWRLDEPADKIYLDRIYSIDRKYEQIILNHAKEQTWLSFDLSPINKMKVYVKKNYGEPSKNPYMDTFKYFGKENDANGGYKYYLTNMNDINSIYTYIDHD